MLPRTLEAMRTFKRIKIVVVVGLSLLIGLAIGEAVRYFWVQAWMDPQLMNQPAIAEWIDEVQNQLDEYMAREKIDINMRPYTGGDGMISVHLRGTVEDYQTTKTVEFIESLHPPRPVWWTVFPNNRKEIQFIRAYPTPVAAKNSSN